MAKIETIVPFILYFEAGLSRSYLTLPCNKMFEHAKKTGYADDPDDAGGATMCGITIATYAQYRNRKGKAQPAKQDLKNISYAEWLEVLKTMFWNRWKADLIANQALANILVDWVWASGGNGIKIPQQILGVTVDGIVGDKTLQALSAKEPKQLFNQIKQARINFVNNIVPKRPSQKKFLKGWLRRINNITYDGLKYE